MLQPSLPYNKLKFALQLFQRAPGDLDGDQHDAVCSRAKDECALQEKILASQKGQKVVVPEKTIHEAIAGIAERYESAQAFEDDLSANGLDLSAMAGALEVDIAVDATMAQVAARVETPTDAQVAEVFAAADKEKLEQCRLRHILITINDQFPENSRLASLARITTIRAKALAPGVDFSELAQRYSECPSALQGGSIGPVGRGRLYPSLAEALFTMAAGEVSEVVESNMGFHVLLCEEVIKAKVIEKTEAFAKIRQALLGRARKKAVQVWLATL